MKVSFDYDHSLTNPKLQKLASKFISLGAEVYITTSRLEQKMNKSKLPYDNREVFRTAELLGIEKKNIHFTNGKDKAYFLKDFDLHFDDLEEETSLINEFCENCVGALIE